MNRFFFSLVIMLRIQQILFYFYSEDLNVTSFQSERISILHLVVSLGFDVREYRMDELQSDQQHAKYLL